jgi:hypothetical protein
VFNVPFCLLKKKPFLPTVPKAVTASKKNCGRLLLWVSGKLLMLDRVVFLGYDQLKKSYGKD